MDLHAFADDLRPVPAPAERRAIPIVPGSVAPHVARVAAPGGYTARGGPRWSVLAGILLFHALAIAVLATAKYAADARDRADRVTTFEVDTPAPPPPAEPVKPQQAVTPLMAPAPPLTLSRPAPIQVAPITPEVAVAGPVNVVVAPPAPAAPPAPQQPAAPAPITPPDFSAAQLRNPGPAYPFLSRRAREEGVVLLKVLVSTDGRAKQLQIEDSSGFDRLDQAALNSVRKWRFVPASQAGQPREAWVLVPVTFSLD